MNNSKNILGNTSLISILIFLLLCVGYITFEHIRGKMILKESIDKTNQQLKDNDIDPCDFNFNKDIIDP